MAGSNPTTAAPCASLADAVLRAKERREADLRDFNAALARLAKRYPKLSLEEKVPTLRERLLAVCDTVYIDEKQRLCGTDEPVTYGEMGEAGRDAVAVLDMFRHGGDWPNAKWESLDRKGKARARRDLRAPGLQRGRPPFRYPALVDRLASIISTMIGIRPLPFSRPYLSDPARRGKPSGPAFNTLMAALRYACFSGDPPEPETVVSLLKKLPRKNRSRD